MARYIDADLLIENIAKIEDLRTLSTKTIGEAISNTPTADVVEVEKYNDLREKFVDYACSGTNNLAPYCENRCAECVDGRGWCRYGRSCKGFNPDGERRTDNE